MREIFSDLYGFPTAGLRGGFSPQNSRLFHRLRHCLRLQARNVAGMGDWVEVITLSATGENQIRLAFCTSFPQAFRRGPIPALKKTLVLTSILRVVSRLDALDLVFRYPRQWWLECLRVSVLPQSTETGWGNVKRANYGSHGRLFEIRSNCTLILSWPENSSLNLDCTRILSREKCCVSVFLPPGVGSRREGGRGAGAGAGAGRGFPRSCRKLVWRLRKKSRRI